MFVWNSLAFLMTQQMLAIWSLVPLPFLKPAWTSGSSRFMYCCIPPKKENLVKFSKNYTSLWYLKQNSPSPPSSQLSKMVASLVVQWIRILSRLAQSCPTHCNPMDCSLPGSSVHGIFQAIVLEWIVISFSRGSSQPRDWTQVSLIVDRRFTVWATREVPRLIQTRMLPPKPWLSLPLTETPCWVWHEWKYWGHSFLLLQFMESRKFLKESKIWGCCPLLHWALSSQSRGVAKTEAHHCPHLQHPSLGSEISAVRKKQTRNRELQISP